MSSSRENRRKHLSRKRRKDQESQDAPDDTHKQDDKSILDGGKFKPGCDEVKNLQQWLEYTEHISFDYQVDLFTYIFKGHAILAAHQKVLYHRPSHYLWFLLELPIIKEKGVQNLSPILLRSAEGRVSDMIEAHSLLEQLAIACHGGTFGQCEAIKGALGWSPVTQLWHLLCAFKFHTSIVQRLLYVAQNEPEINARLHHIRHVPRDTSIYELCCGNGDAQWSGESMSNDQSLLQQNFGCLPRELCPMELCHSVKTLAPNLIDDGCVLYPSLAIGSYTQFQVYEQLSFLSQRSYDINIGQECLAMFVRALHLRACELMHFTYVAPNAWKPALLPCDVTPSVPLDMLPPERYRLAHRFGGVAPHERPMTVDLSSIVQQGKSANKGPYEYKPDKASDTESVSPSRAFIDEILGVIAPLFRQMILVRNITKPPKSMFPTRDITATIAPSIPDEETFLNQLAIQCASALISTTNTSGSVTEMTYSILQMVFDGMLDFQRSRIVDLSYRDDLCVHMRRMCFASNWPERYAHVPTNMFARTYDSEQLENSFLPRLVFQSRNDQWRQLELHELENAPYIPQAARTYAQMSVMRVLGYNRGENESWTARYALFHFQLEQLSDRLMLDDSPFVLVLGARCYVRRKDQFMECVNVRRAMLLWLVFMSLDHPSEHQRDCLKSVDTSHWTALMKQLLENGMKYILENNQKKSLELSETNSHKSSSRAHKGSNNPLEIDTAISDASSCVEDNSDFESDQSSSSENEEDLVEQYMLCDNLL
jgi:hypothetical protein